MNDKLVVTECIMHVKGNDFDEAVKRFNNRVAELESALKRISTGWTYKEADELSQIASEALSGDGSSILKRLEASERVANALKGILPYMDQEIYGDWEAIINPRIKEANESLVAYDALKKEGL